MSGGRKQPLYLDNVYQLVKIGIPDLHRLLSDGCWWMLWAKRPPRRARLGAFRFWQGTHVCLCLQLPHDLAVHQTVDYAERYFLSSSHVTDDARTDIVKSGLMTIAVAHQG